MNLREKILLKLSESNSTDMMSLGMKMAAGAENHSGKTFDDHKKNWKSISKETYDKMSDDHKSLKGYDKLDTQVYHPKDDKEDSDKKVLVQSTHNLPFPSIHQVKKGGKTEHYMDSSEWLKKKVDAYKKKNPKAKV